MRAKRSKNWSPGPNTTEGRRITAPGMLAVTAASPSALLRAYLEAECASAPRAERCTKRSMPRAFAASAMLRAPMACTLRNFWRPVSCRTPTTLTQASAPSSARPTEAGMRTLACTTSIWPTSPSIGRR